VSYEKDRFDRLNANGKEQELESGRHAYSGSVRVYSGSVRVEPVETILIVGLSLTE
jgi:hypothetical protein